MALLFTSEEKFLRKYVLNTQQMFYNNIGQYNVPTCRHKYLHYTKFNMLKCTNHTQILVSHPFTQPSITHEQRPNEFLVKRVTCFATYEQRVFCMRFHTLKEKGSRIDIFTHFKAVYSSLCAYSVNLC